MLTISRYRAVLFDFFGTLTTAVTRGSWQARVARHLGCDPDAFIELLNHSFRVRARGSFGTPEATLRWVCAQLGSDPTPAAVRAAHRARVVGVRADLRLRPDAVATLTEARARGLRTAVVSDCTYELPDVLPRLPVAGLLDTCVYSVEVGECKPHPAMYAAACHRLQVAPGECLYIGDGGGQELTGAVAVGMDAVRLATPDLRAHLVFRPDREFSGPSAPSLTEALRFAWPRRPARAGTVTAVPSPP